MSERRRRRRRCEIVIERVKTLFHFSHQKLKEDKKKQVETRILCFFLIDDFFSFNKNIILLF